METVVLDTETRAKLNGLNKQLKFLDEKGNVLGYYLPPDGYDALISFPGTNPFSDEEIAEAMKDKSPGRPLADILADLRRKYP